LLARIAAEYFQRGEIFFREEDISNVITNFIATLPDSGGQLVDGEVVLKAIEAQHGVLVERAYRVHSFSHLSFQEYFTSRYIIENDSERVYKQLMRHLLDTRWHEIFIMVAGFLPNADMFFEIFVDEMNRLINGDSKMRNLRENLMELSSLSPDRRLAILVLGLSSNLRIRVEINVALEESRKLLSFYKGKGAGFASSQIGTVRRNITEAIEKARKSISSVYQSNKIEQYVDQIRLMIDVDTNIDYLEGLLRKIEDNISNAGNLIHEISSTYSISVIADAKDEIDKERTRRLITDLIERIKLVCESLNEIENLVGVSFSDRRSHWPIERISLDSLGQFIYLQMLFLRCLRVSAVSGRNFLLKSTFLL